MNLLELLEEACSRIRAGLPLRVESLDELQDAVDRYAADFGVEHIEEEPHGEQTDARERDHD